MLPRQTKRTQSLRYFFLIAGIFFFQVACANSIDFESPPELFELSLEDLLKVKVYNKAAITKVDNISTPALITRISASQIRQTPARNIYDLLEVYVPGAFWMNHEEGPHPGIRGSIVNRNYKFLLLVNNRLMNHRSYYGAKSELEMWQLSDIEQIEVIRGPGSVVFGPGAVAGVINIITKRAEDLKVDELNLSYYSEYQSKGIGLNHKFEFAGNDFFQHFSVTDTNGSSPNNFLVTKDNEAGFIGQTILLDEQPLDYFNDAQNKPQIKWHLETKFANEWRFWTRYTQQGSSWRGNEVKSNFDGKLLNQHSTRDRQLTVAFEKAYKLNEKTQFQTMMSYDTYDVERRGENVRHSDPDHPLNLRLNFAEEELYFSGQFNWSLSENTEIAFGAEYSHERYGAGWGDSSLEMRLGEDGNIVSGPDSLAISASNGGSADDDGTEIFVGSGLSSNTLSIFSEANLKTSETNRWLLSARLDKNTYTDILISPRVAFIKELDGSDVFKVIAQRSSRMNTAGQLYSNHVNNRDSKPEYLNGIEFIYSKPLENAAMLTTSLFYNDSQVIGWQGDDNQTKVIGDLQLWGLEIEFQKSKQWGAYGANFSYIKQQDWKMAEDVFASGISYSDYDLEIGDGRQIGEGNSLNNWPTFALKFYGQFKLSDRLNFHINARYFSEMSGALDGLEGLQRAVENTDDEAAVNQSIAFLRSADIYGDDFRINTSLIYQINDKLMVTAFVQNLFGSNDNRRYSYDTGNDDPAPRRVRFIEEPLSIGVNLNYSF